MFKTTLTAAAFTLTASLANTMPSLDTAVNPALDGIIPAQELSAYCEWATIYDYYGNWFTVWQCF